MAGYDKGGALILLDDYNLFPSEGVFMPSDGNHLETKFEKQIAADGDKMYTLANTRGSCNVLVRWSTKVTIEHEFDTDHIDIFVTFRDAMDQTVKPEFDLWLCEVDNFTKPITGSAWQGAWELLLTVPNISVRPDQVTLEYEGPDENLKTAEDKEWEPWGPILSIDIGPA